MASLTDQLKEKYPHMTDKEISQLVRLQNRETKAKEQQRKLRAKASTRKRKHRTKLLCDVGGLIVKSGLENMDKATLLGALMAIKKTELSASTNEDYMKRIEGWKVIGTKAMNKKGPVEVTPETSEPEKVITTAYSDNKR